MSSNSIPKKSSEDDVEGKLEPLLGSEGTAAKELREPLFLWQV